ncbi:SDR family NAD(P)-dependent oxidoreductase [Streptomyces sp. NPDC056909]|uniref:SDR family NAD(P)-dependent oxidoreductase n=1 Tax=Streptomyces sp. NPDC056909 TaxID=3345963 RepID=UPI0036C2ADF3
MSKVIAVFGAGSGLGVSLARRFGREGFRVALVARRKDRLDALVEQLAGEGIEAAAFPGDLSLPAVAPVLVDAIRTADAVHEQSRPPRRRRPELRLLPQR